jgi:hypothetical protein
MDVFIFFFNIPVYPGYRQVFANFNETLQEPKTQGEIEGYN